MNKHYNELFKTHKFKKSFDILSQKPRSTSSIDLRSHNNSQSIIFPKVSNKSPIVLEVPIAQKLALKDEDSISQFSSISPNSAVSRKLSVINDSTIDRSLNDASISNLVVIKKRPTRNQNASIAREGDHEPSERIFCKICYEVENKEKGKLIKPCICSGSMKFIHEDCLKKWIEGKENYKEINVCEICKSEYKIKLDTKTVLSSSKVKKYLCKLLCCIIGLSSILVSVCISLYFIVGNFTSMSKNQMNIFINSIVGVCVAVVGLVTIIKCVVYSRKLYDVQLINWTVLNFESTPKVKSLQDFQV